MNAAQKAWATRRARAGLAPSLRTHETVVAELRDARSLLRAFERRPLGPERNAKAKQADSLIDKIARLTAELSTLSPSQSQAPVVTPMLRRRDDSGWRIPEGGTLCTTIQFRTTPLSEAESAALEIPAFLRRAAS